MPCGACSIIFASRLHSIFDKDRHMAVSLLPIEFVQAVCRVQARIAAGPKLSSTTELLNLYAWSSPCRAAVSEARCGAPPSKAVVKKAVDGVVSCSFLAAGLQGLSARQATEASLVCSRSPASCSVLHVSSWRMGATVRIACALLATELGELALRPQLE